MPVQNPPQSPESFGLCDTLLHDGVEYVPVQLARGAQPQPGVSPPGGTDALGDLPECGKGGEVLEVVVQSQPVGHLIGQGLYVVARCQLPLGSIVGSPDANANGVHQQPV